MKAMPRNISSLCLLLWLIFECMVTVSASSARSSNSGSGSVPIIDIRSWTQPHQFSDEERQSTAVAVGQACRDIGFFAITGHNLSLQVIEKAWSETAAFFDLPAEEKLKLQSSEVASYPYGYEQSERLSVGKRQQHSAGKRNDDVVIQEEVPPDLKETFSIGPSNPQSGMLPRRFPTRPPGFANALDAYYQEMEHLAGILLQIFAVALQLPRDWFEDKMDHHMSALRVLNYFPVHQTSSSSTVEGSRSAARTQIRASAHTDYGALTILKSGGPGLQVKKDDSHTEDDDAWIDVPTLDDAFVINIGDMMQRWTNGTYERHYCNG